MQGNTGTTPRDIRKAETSETLKLSTQIKEQEQPATKVIVKKTLYERTTSSLKVVKLFLLSKKMKAADLLECAKRGARTWNEAKLDVTLSVAASLYKGGKKKVYKKSKALVRYTISIPQRIKAKLPAQTKRLEINGSIPQESIKLRKCQSLDHPNQPISNKQVDS